MHLGAAFGARVHLRVGLGVHSALLFVWTAKAQDVEHAEVATARAAHASRLAANRRTGSRWPSAHSRGRCASRWVNDSTLDLEFRDDSGPRHLFDPIADDRSGRLSDRTGSWSRLPQAWRTRCATTTAPWGSASSAVASDSSRSARRAANALARRNEQVRFCVQGCTWCTSNRPLS